MHKKLILFVVFIAFVFAGLFAAREPLTTTFFEWYLKGYCRTCLGSRLSYESLRHSEGQWILEHPVLTTKKRLEEGGYRCQAESARVNVSIAWTQRALTFSIHAVNPHVDIGKTGEDLRVALKNPSPSFRMFEVHTEFFVPQGALFVHDFTEDHLVPVPLFFHINLACKEKREGCASLWLGGNDRTIPSFHADFFENELQEPQIRFEISDLNCAYLQPLIKGLWPEYGKSEILKGNVNGKVNVAFPHHSPPYAEGRILLNDLTLNQKDIECQVEISEIDLTIAPKIKEIDGEKSIKTIGSFSIKPSRMTLNRQQEPFWRIEAIAGSTTFEEDGLAEFSLNGKVWNKEKYRKLKLEGKGYFAKSGQTGFTVDMQLTGEEEIQEHTDFHFFVQELGDQWNFAEMEISGFGCEELDLIQYLISKNYPQWKWLHLQHGNIDAAIVVYLNQFRLSEVKVERVAAHHLSFSFEPWNLYAGMESAVGTLSFDLSKEDPLATLNTDLKINQGTLNLEGLDKALWQLSGIDANLTVSNGIFQKSILKGTVAGLNAKIELDGTSSGPLIHFNFDGKIKDAVHALPDYFRKGLEKQFISDEVKIIANAKKTEEGLLFKGKINLEEDRKSEAKIDFGFILSHSAQELQDESSSLPLSEACSKTSTALISTASGSTALYSACQHLLSQDFFLSKVTVKNGWFRTGKLSLDKYLSPFVFLNNQMELGGLGEFFGHFNKEQLMISYNAEDLVLKNSDFAIEIKNLREGLPLSSKFPATFVFDFDKKTSTNAFLIRNGTYFEKNSGLLYTEISAALTMKDATAHFEDLTTFCNGLFFSGSADVDWSMPGEGVFEVEMHAKEMHGKISQLQHLLSHLNKSLVFLKIPIDGNVGLRNDGGRLHFSFQKEGYEIQSTIQGTMTDGIIDVHPADMTLQELSMNFSYNHKEKNLEFSEIQGTLFVGKPSYVEEYTLCGDKIRFTDFSRDEGEFDVWVGDRFRDIVRLSGKTRSATNDEGVPYINFIFNKSLSHFGNVHPAIFQLGIKEWSQLEQFKLSFDFKMEELLTDLKRFSRTGLFFLSRGLLKELNEIENAKGLFHTDIHFDPLHSALHYRIDGHPVSFGQREYLNFLLLGTKKGNLWSVDQLQFDHLSLAFDVMKEGSLWNIDFLGLRMGDYLLVGMEGQYSDEDAHLKAKIHLLEADISKLQELELPLLTSSENFSSISGRLKATGILNAIFDKAHPQGMSINLQLNGLLTRARFKDIYFDDIKNLSLHYDSKKGFSLRDLDIGVKSFDSILKARIFLSYLGFNLSHPELLIDGLHFDIPSEHLAWVVQSLQTHFPDKISGSVAEILRSSKNQGSLQGSLRLSTSDAFSSFRLHLNDGFYQFMGNQHDLSGLVIDYDPFSLKIFTEYRYKKQRFRLNAHSTDHSFNSGEMVISDLLENPPTSLPLTIFWKVHPSAGYYIERMSGNLSGLMFDLVQDPAKPLSNHALNLIGRLQINFRKTVNLLEEGTAAKIANLKLGDGYSLAGYWHVLKEPSKQISDSLFFQGEFSGRDFEFYGYRFQNLTATLSYSPEAAYIRNLAVADNCGNAGADQIDFFHQGGSVWQANIPEATIKGFRPRFLHPIEGPPHRISKSLVLRSFNIKNVNGILGDRNSFKGSGQLSFANPPKKYMQNSFLAIPVELMTRIGLDLAVLTPVRGTIIFDIREGKAILKRFKDVYSKGRLSKFYLSNNGGESYVDFDGNLNFQVRMNQYNIFFKLAELFTFTVQGTLKKPSYALLKTQLGTSDRSDSNSFSTGTRKNK